MFVCRFVREELEVVNPLLLANVAFGAVSVKRRGIFGRKNVPSLRGAGVELRGHLLAETHDGCSGARLNFAGKLSARAIEMLDPILKNAAARACELADFLLGNAAKNLPKRSSRGLRDLLQLRAGPAGQFARRPIELVACFGEMSGRPSLELKSEISGGLGCVFFQSDSRGGERLLDMPLQPRPCFLLEPFGGAADRFGSGVRSPNAGCVQFLVPLREGLPACRFKIAVES